MQERKYNGLSPSSFSLFQGCQRKYFYRKVAKLPIDTDAVEDYSAFQIGKAFHKVLEDTGHNLSAYKIESVTSVCGEFDIHDAESVLKIFAMLKVYMKVHTKSQLRAIACEQVIDTPSFYGIVDVVLEDAEGRWWIGDMKTAATFNSLQEKTLHNHPQLNLYAAHYRQIAESLKIDPELFQGCRYRVTTKSKLVKKAGELPEAYIARVTGNIRSLDFALPKEIMRPEAILSSHRQAVEFINLNSTKIVPELFSQNFGNCMASFRPCEFTSRCHGCNFSDAPKLEVISN